MMKQSTKRANATAHPQANIESSTKRSDALLYYSIRRWQAMPSKTKAVGDAAHNHQADAPEYRLDNAAFGIDSEAAA